MTTRAYRIASTGRYCDSVAFVEVEINLAQLLSGANAITTAVAGKALRRKKTEIDNSSIRIVNDEIFVAMAAAPHGRAIAGVDNALQDLRSSLRRIAQIDIGGGFIRRGRPALIPAQF